MDEAARRPGEEESEGTQQLEAVTLVEIEAASEGKPRRWQMVELQGELLPVASSTGAGGEEAAAEDKTRALAGKELGTLEFVNGAPVLVIGNNRLDGKVVPMPKPFAVLRRVRVGEADAQACAGTHGEGVTVGATYRVEGVIESKLLFKTRPKPIVDAAAISNRPGVKRVKPSS